MPNYRQFNIRFIQYPPENVFKVEILKLGPHIAKCSGEKKRNETVLQSSDGLNKVKHTVAESQKSLAERRLTVSVKSVRWAERDRGGRGGCLKGEKAGVVRRRKGGEGAGGRGGAFQQLYSPE